MRFKLASILYGALLLVNLSLARVPEEGDRELSFEVLGREVPSIMIDSSRDESQSGLIDTRSGSLVLLAIRAEEHWKKFVAGSASASYQMLKALAPEEPDFSKDMVLAVGTFHVGDITGQGRSREAMITRIIERPDRLSVYVCEGMERIGGGCLGQFFFHVVRLPRSDKRIELITES